MGFSEQRQLLPSESKEEAQANAQKNLARAQQAIPAWLNKKEDKIAKTLRKLNNPRELASRPAEACERPYRLDLQFNSL